MKTMTSPKLPEKIKHNVGYGIIAKIDGLDSSFLLEPMDNNTAFYDGHKISKQLTAELCRRRNAHGELVEKLEALIDRAASFSRSIDSEWGRGCAEQHEITQARAALAGVKKGE